MMAMDWALGGLMGRAETPLKLRLIDLYLGLSVLVLLVQTAYFFSFELLAATDYVDQDLDAVVGGITSAAGSFVLGVCLRLQVVAAVNNAEDKAGKGSSGQPAQPVTGEKEAFFTFVLGQVILQYLAVTQLK